MANMPSFSLLRPSTYVCTRCAFRTANVSHKTTRRWIGMKYLAKVADAETKWQERALEIKDGKHKSMLSILEERNLVEAMTGTREEIDKMLIEHRIGAYVGIDPTAASLHIGHMLPLMSLFWMYVHGYHAITLLGGTTSKIGDPTGRDTAREKVHRSVRVQNMANMHFQLKKLWVNVEAYGRKHGYTWDWAWKRALLNNTTWFQSLTWEEALSIIGHTPTGPMLAKRTVKNKLGKGDGGLTYAELSYPLMQAWDWWHMYNTQGIRMQIGGSDQYGNITAGIQAVKHIAVHHPNPEFPKKTTEPPFGLTTPLLTTSTGAKFGKSAGNAIWLDSTMTSTFDLYKYFLGTSDSDVGGYLRQFTFMKIEDIDKLLEEHMKEPSERKAQHKLASEFVELVHGEKAAKDTAQEHRDFFHNKTMNIKEISLDPKDPVGASALELAQVNLNNRPRAHLKLPRSFIFTKSIGKILYACGLANSAGEGHRLAAEQSVYVGGGADTKKEAMTSGAVNWNPVRTWRAEETSKFLVYDTLLFIRRGKSNIRFIEVVEDDEFNRLGLRFPGDGKGPIDLTKKQPDRPPPVITDLKPARLPQSTMNYSPVWVDVPSTSRADELRSVKSQLESSKWNSHGRPNVDDDEDIDSDMENTFDPDERIKELQRNLDLEITKNKLQFDIKHAPKGKFLGHNSPRGRAPRV